MGLVVRLYDIVSPNKFKLNIGLSPYGSFTQVTNSEDPNGEWLPSTSGTTSTTHRNYRTDPICITNDDPPISGSTCFVYTPLEFDTRYFLKLQDTFNVVDNCETSPCINGSELRHIIESIYISDSKTFDCYDKIKFDVDYVCLTPTPTPSATPNPTALPNPTPLPSSTPNPTANPTPQPTPQCLRYIITVTDQKIPLVVEYTDCATGQINTESVNPSTSETLCSLTQPVRSSGTQQYYIGEGTDNCANAPTPIPTETPQPTPNPTSNPTPNPTPEATPNPTPEPTGLCIEVSDFVARTDAGTTFTWEDCDGNSHSMNIPQGDAAPPSSGACVRQGTISWVPSGGNARVDLAINPSGVCDGGEPVTPQCYNYTLVVPSMGETTSTFSYTACNGDQRTWTGLSGDNTSVCAQDGTVSVTSGPGTYNKGSEC